MVESRLLKKDHFGEVRHEIGDFRAVIVRDVSNVPAIARWFARRLLHREARTLERLKGISGVPELLATRAHSLARSYIAGRPLYEARTTDPAYFRAALRLLFRVHRRNVVHNDLAKEPNVLVQSDGLPAFVDYQLAWAAKRRGRLFRLLAYEDLRHLLKHKRSYCPEQLSTRQRRILATPSPLSRLYRRTVKPVYLLVTRRFLGWADREGAADRGRR